MSNKQEIHEFHLHLVSDATGATIQALARACLAQFEDISPTQRLWPLVRTQRRLRKVIEKIKENPGPVIYTLVNKDLRKALQSACEEIGVPCMPVLNPILRGLSSYLGLNTKQVPGLQHIIDDAYINRVDALDFAMHFDDGKTLEGLKKADIILIGVSRTSKTPTSVYLARRGVRVANIPLVPGVEIPKEKLEIKGPMYVGLIATPDHLVQLRRTRLKVDNKCMGGMPTGQEHIESSDYLDLEKIEKEIKEARAIFSQRGWPIINVSKRSIEETAAEILSLYQAHKEAQNNE